MPEGQDGDAESRALVSFTGEFPALSTRAGVRRAPGEGRRVAATRRPGSRPEANTKGFLLPPTSSESEFQKKFGVQLSSVFVSFGGGGQGGGVGACQLQSPLHVLLRSLRMGK